MSGQINRGSRPGELIYDLSRDTTNKTFVEIGTWNGQGSTKCFMDALFERDDDSVLYSIESHSVFYDQAVTYWAPITAAYRRKKIHLLLGRIIEPSEIMTLEEIKTSEVGPPRHTGWEEWHSGDIKWYNKKECINIFDKLPPSIDVLLLDGGEFSSYAEYKKINDRANIILLDDSNILKNYDVKKDLLVSKEWDVLKDYSNERNGFIAFKRASS
tara:strand:+ start:2656 stop:3297 length:642 start_codon:yes stop_codon:yes gene_type:complete